jgi:fatty acid desaturase
MSTPAAALQKPGNFLSRGEIRSLRVVNPLAAWWGILHCWGVILATWVAVGLWPHPLTVLLGIMIIGTRQLGLGVLNHDAAHFTLFDNKVLNDWVAEWLLNRPLLGGSVAGYRKAHLGHHRFTQQPNDPDLYLSKPFPVDPASLRRKIIRDLTGQTGFKQYGATIREAFRGETVSQAFARGMKRLGPNIAINVVFLAGFALAGQWYLYFLLWWVPALTWNRFVTRLRNIAEHGAVPDNDDRLRNTRTVIASIIERAFIAPYRVNYHLEHHLLVSCPFYRLPEMHRLLIARGLGPRMEVRYGYRDMLRQVVRSRPVPAT